jgi:hypothetical protein
MPAVGALMIEDTIAVVTSFEVTKKVSSSQISDTATDVYAFSNEPGLCGSIALRLPTFPSL